MGNIQTKQRFNRKEFLIHFAFWVLILHLLFDISGLYYSFREIFVEGDIRMDDAFIFVPMLIGLFYWNTNVLIPKFLTRKTWWKYLLGIFLSLILLIFLGRIIFSILENKGYFFEVDVDEFSDFFFQFGLFVIAISASLGVGKMALENSEKQEIAEAKQKEAELKFLTAQVNPHFLFNSLNTIYSLSVEEEANQTMDAILKLSQIMRYPLKEGLQKEVPLANEVKFLEDYIELQKARLGKEYPIKLKIKGDISTKKIAPLLFISFVENAFKYGISNSYQYPIDMLLEVSTSNIYFQVNNTILKEEQAESSGLGIKNVKQRLELLYPDRHDLVIKKEGNQFAVFIELQFS